VEAISWSQHDKSITNLLEDEVFVKNLMDVVYFCFASGQKKIDFFNLPIMYTSKLAFVFIHLENCLGKIV
jgi:hypothetical protein